MKCPNCNYKTTPDKRYCERCGTMLNQNIDINTSETNQIKSFITKHKVKIILGLVIVCIVSAVIYFNSVTYLEKKLTKYTWYQVPDYDTHGSGYGGYASDYKFYSNGEYKHNNYAYGVYGWTNIDSERDDWEILDDKTLCIDGVYYEWKTEWHLSGNTLSIHKYDDYTYHTKDKWSYSDSD